MRFGLGVLLVLGLMSFAAPQAHASQIRMLEHGLSWGDVKTDSAGVSTGGSYKLHLDDGSGGSAGYYVLEGCASLATEIVVAIAGGFVLLGSVAVAGAGGANESSLAAGAVILIILLDLAIPAATSGIVNWLASGDGENPSFLKTYVYSIVTRLVFGVLQYVTKSAAVAYIGIFAGAVAEVYAANSGPGFGGGGDVGLPEMTKRKLESRGELSASNTTAVAAVAPSANLFAMHF